MFNKIKNTFKAMSILQDVDTTMSKIEWYDSVLPSNIEPKYTYFVQYHGYTHVVSWGPFYTMEQARTWVDSTQQKHNISCNIIPAINPKADSKYWPL